jgi:hypothetical protein
MSKQGCGPSIERCQRRSTVSSPISWRTSCLPRLKMGISTRSEKNSTKEDPFRRKCDDRFPGIAPAKDFPSHVKRTAGTLCAGHFGWLKPYLSAKPSEDRWHYADCNRGLRARSASSTYRVSTDARFSLRATAFLSGAPGSFRPPAPSPSATTPGPDRKQSTRRLRPARTSLYRHRR